MKVISKAFGLSLSVIGLLALASCGRNAYPTYPLQNPYYGQYLQQASQYPQAQYPGYRPMVPMYGQQAYQPVLGMQSYGLRAPGDLVEAPGFVSGDRVQVKGPLWFKGQGTLHQINPNAFDLEFTISSYHLRVSATRINATQARFVTVDYKNNRTEETVAQYSRTGNTTVFNIGAGKEVEKLTVMGKGAGYMEAIVVQPSQAMSPLSEGRGETTLKFYKD